MMVSALSSGLPDQVKIITSLLTAQSAQAGLPLDAVLAELGSKQAMPSARADEATSNKLIRLLEIAARALRDDSLGFHLAVAIDLRQLGILHYLVTSAATLGDALSVAARSGPGIFEAVVLRLERSSQAIRLRFDYEGAERHRDRHLIEFWATVLLRSLREAIAADLTPIEAEFRHRRRDIPDDMKRFFGHRLAFGENSDGLAFELRAEGLPISGADPFLHEVLVQQLDVAMAARSMSPTSFRIRIENEISPRLPHGGVSMGVVAKELGMSVRTLSRRLFDEHTSFSQVLAKVRGDLARIYIEDPLIPVSHIAWLLGYKDASAFVVAFRRWTGMSPTEARAKLRPPG